MNPKILDAEWRPANDADLIQHHQELNSEFLRLIGREAEPTSWESPTKTCDPVAYSQRCRRIRRTESRRLTTFVQRLLLGSALFLAWVVLLALLWG